MQAETSSERYLLTTDAVRWAITTLAHQRLHPTFVMYLYLRKQQKLGRLATASARSPEIISLIQVPGNPTKPYYFPLIDRGERTGQLLDSFWRAKNISGSWSPGSVGRQQAGGWLASGDAYTVPNNHADLALAQMLYGTKVSALALGSFFLRNDALIIAGDPAPADIVTAFRLKFDYATEDDPEFDKLYSSDQPADDIDWFEPMPEPQSEPVVA